MTLQITNQTILGVCVFGWGGVCLGRQPSQCGRISGPPALLSRSFLPGEGGNLENTCIPPSLGSSLWKLFAHRQHRFPSALSTLEEVLWVRLCLVGRSPWLSNGTGEQRPNSGQGISTSGPGLKPSASLSFNQEEISWSCAPFFPSFDTGLEMGVMFTDPLKHQWRSCTSSAYKPSGSFITFTV